MPFEPKQEPADVDAETAEPQQDSSAGDHKECDTIVIDDEDPVVSRDSG